MMKNRYELPELLAPAGNLEKLQTALLYGADAVYLAGPQYGLRAKQTAFSKEDLAKALDLVHAQGKKLYVTVNILAHEGDLKGLEEYLVFLEELGVDAIIASDAGIAATALKVAPNLDLHISTQASLTNSAAVNFWHEQGAKRVVLARELSLEEISQTRSQIAPEMELEAFVHGAMCMAYSGRCLLSNHLSGGTRDANAGNCSQPCRWRWQIEPLNNEQGHQLILEETEQGSFFFNSNDLCLIEHIPSLIQAGINSFKIEGRMKGSYYVAVVTKTYREALDLYARVGPEMWQVQEQWLRELNSMVHRNYATGFYFDLPQENAQTDWHNSYYKEAYVVGRVLADSNPGDEYLHLQQKNKIELGDTLELLRPQGPSLELTVSQIWDEEGQEITATPHPQSIYYLKKSDIRGLEPEASILAGSFLRKLGNKD